jgi:hypothetical protein
MYSGFLCRLLVSDSGHQNDIHRNRAEPLQLIATLMPCAAREAHANLQVLPPLLLVKPAARLDDLFEPSKVCVGGDNSSVDEVGALSALVALLQLSTIL